MSDLISRKALIEKISDDRFDISIKDKRKLIDSIRKQPTAYDVDKVVEDLEQLKHPYLVTDSDKGLLHNLDLYVEKAKGIVKGAVNDE
ncbi:MAG: hypothetical protein K0R00_3183 [Herbinix sp.]|jgi:hypothetical protein|nr:hypothetical protein [Herbinix sp.]